MIVFRKNNKTLRGAGLSALCKKMGVIAAGISLALLCTQIGSGRVELGLDKPRRINLIVPCMKMSTSTEMTSPDLGKRLFRRQLVLQRI